MNRIRVAAFFCTVIFAIGLWAAQNQGAQTSPNQIGRPATQTPQTVPPGQGTPPASSPGSESSGQGAEPRSRMSNIDEQVKVLSDHLNLNQDQQSKVRSILLDQHDQAMALIQDNSMERQAKIDKIHNLRAATIDKVRQVLTSDQRPRFDEMVQQQDDRMRQRQEQNGAGTSNAPPSNPSAGTPPTSPNRPPR